MIALDSNCVTYLLDAMESGYHPEEDDDAKLRPQRVAMLRTFLYGDTPYITATAKAEVERISDAEILRMHEMITNTLIREIGGLDGTTISQRASEFSSHHQRENDCTILAEAEAAGATSLLTFDSDFRTHLTGLSGVSILMPSDHWLSLEFEPGSPPRVRPHPSNPLSKTDWWRV